MKKLIKPILIVLILISAFDNSFAQNMAKAPLKNSIILISKELSKTTDSLLQGNQNRVKSGKVEIEIPISGNYLYAFPPYPIPAKEHVSSLIYWDTKLDIKDAEMGVYDINCNKICGKEKIILNRQTDYCGVVTWNSNAVVKGIYFIQIKHGTATLMIKIIIE
ncbi:MAG: hypothetical protein WCR42_00585 [bacterium]